MSAIPVQFDGAQPNMQAQASYAGGSTIPVSEPAESQGTVMDAMSAAIREQDQLVKDAAKKLAATPQTLSSGQARPSMPVPSLRAGLFNNSSVNNNANYHPTTRAGMRAKGIGQIAGMAGNLIGGYMKKKEAEKTQQLSLDLQRTLDLTQGIDQAQQLLQQDPNNPQAKAQLQKNQAMLGNMLNDPKRAKAIAKAFDVSFGEEAQKNANDPHAQAMTGAMKAQQLMENLPKVSTANPGYQQAQMQYQATVKAAQEATKTYSQFAGKVMDNQTTLDVANTRAQAAKDIAAGQIAQRDLASQRTSDTARYGDQLRFRGTEITASAHLQAERERTKAMLSAVKDEKLQTTRMTMATKLSGDLTQQIKDSNDQVTKLQHDLDVAKGKKDSKQTAVIQSQITAQQNAIVDYKNQQQELQLYSVADPDAAGVMGLINGSDNE